MVVRSSLVFFPNFEPRKMHGLHCAQHSAIVTIRTAGTAYRVQNKYRYAVLRSTVPAQIKS